MKAKSRSEASLEKWSKSKYYYCCCTWAVDCETGWDRLVNADGGVEE